MKRSAGRATPLRGDDGTIALLLMICMVIVAALVFTAAAVTQVHLGHQQLHALADAAALDGAGALDGQVYYAAGTTPADGVPVSSPTVREAAAEHLARTSAGAARLQDLALTDPTGSPDGRTAEVTLTARVRPWLLPRALVGLPPSVDLQVTSRARGGLVLP